MLLLLSFFIATFLHCLTISLTLISADWQSFRSEILPNFSEICINSFVAYEILLMSCGLPLSFLLSDDRSFRVFSLEVLLLEPHWPLLERCNLLSVVQNHLGNSPEVQRIIYLFSRTNHSSYLRLNVSSYWKLDAIVLNFFKGISSISIQL